MEFVSETRIVSVISSLLLNFVLIVVNIKVHIIINKHGFII